MKNKSSNPSMTKPIVAALTLCVGVLVPGRSAGDLVLYEGFDYSAGDIDGSQTGGTGFATGGWTTSGSNNPYDVITPGLSFTGLATTGGAVKRPTAPGNAEMHRGISAKVQSELSADGTTVWFSLLTRSDDYASRYGNGALVLGTDAFTDFGSLPNQMAGGEAIGFSYNARLDPSDVNIMSLHGLTIDDGTSTLSTDYILEPQKGTYLYLIAGRIDWAADGSDDVLALYNVIDPAEPLPEPFATMTADLDQSQFDTIAIGSQQISVFDEIRFGSSPADVGLTGASPPSRIEVTIAPSGLPGSFDFEWDSKAGKLYELLSGTDLSVAPESWAVYDPDGPGGDAPYGDIPSSGDGVTSLTGVPASDPQRFFAVLEKDPPPLFIADFESDDGGFAVSTTEGSAWEWGKPDTNGLGGEITTGNGDSTGCWGTVLGDFSNRGVGSEGYYVNPTTTVLRSPVIDLAGVSGAELGFAEVLDLNTADSAEVYIVDDATDTAIGAAVYTASDSDLNAAPWASVGPIALPAGALGQQIYIEWRFSGQAVEYAGWYIDDVVITAE
jgi:hypothetical protein